MFRIRKQREKIYLDRLSDETASRIKWGDEKGNEETDGEYNRTTEWTETTEREREIERQRDKERKSEREREREVYCYFGITLYLHAQPRTLSSLRSNQIPTFAICAWMPLATSAFTAPSAAIGDSKSTNP